MPVSLWASLPTRRADSETGMGQTTDQYEQLDGRRRPHICLRTTEQQSGQGKEESQPKVLGRDVHQ